MATAVLDYVCRAARSGDRATDADLLTSFIGRGEQAAFVELVRRHGPMVLGVCRRVLDNPHDAEDAFQATFLVLVRKANNVRPREMIGNWLYGVAFRTALKARAMANRRRFVESEAAAMRPRALGPITNDRDEWREILDRELTRLP